MNSKIINNKSILVSIFMFALVISLTFACGLLASANNKLTLKTPANNGEDVSVFPTISWEGDDSEWYDVVISSDENFDEKVFTKVTEDEFTAVQSPLKNSYNYFLKITSAKGNVLSSEFKTIKHYPHTGVVAGTVNTTRMNSFDAEEWTNTPDTSAGNVTVSKVAIQDDLYTGSGVQMVAEGNSSWYRMQFTAKNSEQRSWASRAGLEVYMEVLTANSSVFKFQITTSDYSQYDISFALNNAGKYLLQLPFSEFKYNYGVTQKLNTTSILRMDFDITDVNGNDTTVILGDILAKGKIGELNTYDVSGEIPDDADIVLADMNEFNVPDISLNKNWSYSVEHSVDPLLSIESENNIKWLSFLATKANMEYEMEYNAIGSMFAGKAGLSFTLKSENLREGGKTSSIFYIRLVADGKTYKKSIPLTESINETFTWAFSDLENKGVGLTDASTITKIEFGIKTNDMTNVKINLKDLVILKELS